jgi:hypothetical protein
MSPRRVLILSFVIAACVLLTALGLSASREMRLEGVGLEPQWQAPISGAQTLVVARFRPGEPEGLALLASTGVQLLGTDGKVLARLDVPEGIAASATGDADGDGADEVWIVRKPGPPYAAQALGPDLKVKLAVPLGDLSLPVRLLPVDLDGDGRSEIVAGDNKGTLLACDRKGRTLWRYGPPAGRSGADAEVRGLDDVKLPRQRQVAVAYQGGHVARLDASGHPSGQRELGKLRRMRAFDADGDGTDEVLTGTDAGSYAAESAAPGTPDIAFSLGDAITEIRPIEVDGDPRRAEVFLGGKRGAFAFLRGREVLARGTLGSRVSSARGVDTDGDGRDEVFVGTEDGKLHALTFDGHELTSTVALGGRLESIVSVVSPLRDRVAVAAGAAGAGAFRLTRRAPPAWYNPWTAAGLAWLALAAVAIVLLRLRPEPEARAARPAPAPAQARSQALEAGAARIREWIATGMLRAEDAQDRLEQIRRRVAEKTKAAGPTRQSPPPPQRRG